MLTFNINIIVVSKEILEVMNDLVKFLMCLLSTRNFIILVFLDVNLVLYIQLAIVVSLEKSIDL